jgi:hypothetical protein
LQQVQGDGRIDKVAQYLQEQSARTTKGTEQRNIIRYGNSLFFSDTLGNRQGDIVLVAYSSYL